MPPLRSKSTACQLSLLVALVPAVGATSELLLQDTLKSMITTIGALGIAVLFFWANRNQTTKIRVHGVMLLPLALMTHALVSTFWAHAYLANVEAIRWFVFGLILFLGINSFNKRTLTSLAWGIHVGIFVASLWIVLQFCTNFNLFPQGPSPASTFINRNLFAEFAVCALPFSVLLLTRVRDKSSVLILATSVGFNSTAILMTGTRSALLALLLLIVLIPCIFWLFRRELRINGWRGWHYTAIISIVLITVLGVGSLDSNNPKIIAEWGRGDAISRAISRSMSAVKTSEYLHGSVSVRREMWVATGRMIQAHPVAGVGAGAWEVQIPLYQKPGSQIETDYYAHNEILQLIAEYGLVGWAVVIGLLLYFMAAVRNTIAIRHQTPTLGQDYIDRAMALSSLLALFVVANAGFPLRTAGTTMLCSIALAVLAASDKQADGKQRRFDVFRSVPVLLNKVLVRSVGVSMCLLITVAVFVSFKAIECERALITAIQKAMVLSEFRNLGAGSRSQDIAEIVVLVSKGIAVNPHYRKLTPMVADAMANIGEWKTAIWIWESVLISRPNVVAIIANIARGYIELKQYDSASEYIERAKQLQPTAETLISLDVILWSLTGQEEKAVNYAQSLMNSGRFDMELLQIAYHLGIRMNRPEVAIEALNLKILSWPKDAAMDWFKLGNIYNGMNPPQTELALQAFQASINQSPFIQATQLLNNIPELYRSKLIMLPTDVMFQSGYLDNIQLDGNK